MWRVGRVVLGAVVHGRSVDPSVGVMADGQDSEPLRAARHGGCVVGVMEVPGPLI